MRIESTQQSISPVFQQRSRDERTKTGVGRKRRQRSCRRDSKALGSLPDRSDALHSQRILRPRHTGHFLLSGLAFITQATETAADHLRNAAEGLLKANFDNANEIIMYFHG